MTAERKTWSFTKYGHVGFLLYTRPYRGLPYDSDYWLEASRNKSNINDWVGFIVRENYPQKRECEK